jgi:hypothetical protein
MHSRVNKQQEKRRRQRQRRLERKQKKGSKPSIDEELTMRMQVWSVHGPEEINPPRSIDKDCVGR